MPLSGIVSGKLIGGMDVGSIVGKGGIVGHGGVVVVGKGVGKGLVGDKGIGTSTMVSGRATGILPGNVGNGSGTVGDRGDSKVGKGTGCVVVMESLGKSTGTGMTTAPGGIKSFREVAASGG